MALRGEAASPKRSPVVATAFFFVVVLLAWAIILVIGLPLAVLVTPPLVLLGGFILPGLTEAHLPFSAAWLIAIALFASWRRILEMVRDRHPAAVLFAGFLFLLLLLTVRSPDKGQGVRMVVQGGMLLVAALVFRIGLDHVRREWLLGSAVLTAMALALPIIWFRLDPGAEIDFLASGLAHILIEPVSLDELLRGYWFQGNNILSAGKSGAVFINANVASVYLSLHLAGAIGMALYDKRGLLPRFAIPILLIAVLATGSRIGAATSLMMILVVLLAWRTRMGGATSALMAVALLLALPIVMPTAARLQAEVLLSDDRILLWPLAVQRILDHPLIGGGFGDWEAWLAPRLELFNLWRVLPPHNIVLHLVLWGGVVALAVFGTTVVVLAQGIWRQLRGDYWQCALAVGLMLVVMAVLSHSLFDNFFLFDWHVGPAIGALVAIMWIPTRRQQQPAPWNKEELVVAPATGPRPADTPS